MNCLLIEMGEMACYQERCPDCGRIPPGRKKVKPPDLFQKLVGKRLSTKKQTKSTAAMVMGAGIRTNQLALSDTFQHPVQPVQNGQTSYARQASDIPDKTYAVNNGNSYRQFEEDSMV